MTDVDGLRVLVTGAASGLGRAIVEELAGRGASVVAADRAPGAGAPAGPVVPVEADVTDAGACEAAVAVAVERFGGLDAVVANAGVPGEGSVDSLDPDAWRRVLDVHLTGTFLTVRAALPELVRAGGGSVVLQASIAGLVGLPHVAAYSAAKGGIVALGRQVARDYADRGVRVNTIAPGTVVTPLVEQAYAERHGDGAADALATRAAQVPLGRMGEPADVARYAAFLVSRDSAWITGTVLPVDGGVSQLGA